MNKILNFNVQKYIHTLKKGGGQIAYKTPLDFVQYDKLINDLKNILNDIPEKTNDKHIYILFHKDNLPPISSRLNNVMKIIFSNNKLTYISNVLLNEKLGFYYLLSYYEIEHGINVLENIKATIIKIMNKSYLTLSEFFEIINNKNDPKYGSILNLIDIYFNEFTHISKTSLIRLLSLVYYQYDSLIPNITRTTIEDNINTIADFCSKEKLMNAEKYLMLKGIKSSRISDTILDINNNKQAIELEGLVRVRGYDNFYQNLDNNECLENMDLSELLYKKLSNSIIKSHVNVGVIDGGVGTGVIKKYLNYYPISDFLNYTKDDIPKGNHAEEVCSILLFANEFNNHLVHDNCKSPNIHLFDICKDGISSSEFIKLIEIIVEKYHNTIKIWNLSISLDKTSGSETIWNEGISSFGIKLDEMQKKYGIIFIIASGNKNEDINWITSPSDSMMSICVASANNMGFKTNYSLSGNYKENKYFSNKPDVAVKGIDEEGNYLVISEGCYCNKQGTSYATPFITRKVAELFSEGIELYAIPSILNAVAVFYNKNNKNNDDIYVDDYLGYGCIPQNVDHIKSLCNENCMIVSKINVNNYNQGFFSLKLPINDDNKFDLNVILSANVKANFSSIPSFEYVEDTVRVQFGAVDPFGNDGYRLHKNWKLDEIRGDSDDAGIKEESLRKLYNKYKNRYCSAKFLKRNKQSYIVYNGEKKDIKNWGLTFTRNDIRSKRENPIEVYFCLIFSSINNNNIYDYIYNENQIYLGIDNYIENIDDEITFE